jgi:NDP-sugar pyrophosphorylase family protein
MRAMVMAAGLGTRLRPLTNDLPKPLVPVGGKPMIEFVLASLARHGVTEALLNIHYLPEKMRAFVDAWNESGRQPRLSVQDESGKILGSGGGVALAAPWLFAQDDCAIVCNSDVLAQPDLTTLVKAHRASGLPCTLMVMAHPEAGKKFTGLRVEGGKVLSFEKAGSGLFHFPGFYVISKEAVARMPAPTDEFSVVEKLWRPLAAEGKLGAFLYEGKYMDLGTVEDLKAAEGVLGRA